MANSPDYDGNGFNQGGDGAVFGDPGSDPGSVSDYDTWDWKQIEAAINGMSAGVDNSDNQSHALSVSDPQSLQDAADAFYGVQVTLTQIAEAMDAQAKALAGTNGPWKGDAADAFTTMMTTFTRQVQAAADVLSGGATGSHSIPQQLADNAVNLLNAKNKISEIDSWYANQAIAMGVKPMSDGLIPISQKPQLVQMMTSDMRAVLKSLAGDYQVTIDSVRSPQPVTGPTTNQPGPGPDPDDTDTGNPNEPDLGPEQGYSLPESPATDGLTPLQSDARLADGLPLTSDPGLMDAALNPNGGAGDLSPFPGGTGTDGPGSLSPQSLAAFPGGTGTDGPGSLGDTGDLSPFPGGTGTDGPGGVDDTVDPASFPDGTGTDGTGGLPLGGITSPPVTTSREKAKGGTVPLTGGESYPGDLGTDGTGDLGAGGTDGLGAGGTDGLGSGAGFPGGLTTESGLPADGYSGSGSGAGDGLGSGAGMPYMPGGMGGGAGSGQQNQQHERSDASGLLGGDAEPWEGSTDVGGEAGSPLGTLAGGDGLDGIGTPLPVDETSGDGAGDGIGGLGTDDEGLGAGGMPYMPGGMGGGAGSGQQNQQHERSDASGLLGGDAEPWEGTGDVGDEAGSPLGALAGGPGLEGLGDSDGETGSLPGDELPGEALPGDETAAAEGGGMPYMPGMGGGAGSGQQNQQHERSDASGLLGGDAEPWHGLPEAAEDAGALLGTAAGGIGLHGIGGVPATAQPLPEEAAAEEPVADAASTEAEQAAAAEGMPYLPGTGGTGAHPGQEPGAEHSDASGLLDGEADPWEAAPAVADQVGAADGAAPGQGAGLDTGVELAAAEAVLLAGGVAGAAAHQRRRHDDPLAFIPVAVAGEALAWGRDGDELPPAAEEPADPAPGVEPETAEAEAAETAEAAEAEAEAVEVEETAAWDTGGDTLLPLLWGLDDPDEERDVLSSGYATAEDGTWGTRANAPAARGDGTVGAEAESEPSWATWRPDRTPTPGGATAAAVAAAAALNVRSSAASVEEVPAEDEEPEGTEEEPQRRSIADLLVQDDDTWGDLDTGAVL